VRPTPPAPTTTSSRTSWASAATPTTTRRPNRTTASPPASSGYFGFAYYFQNPDQLQAVAIADGDDNYVTPSLETASSGEYTPLSRNLYTYPSMSSLAEEHIAEFARYFVEQTTNEEIVANDVGYVPATEETQEAQLSKLEDAIAEAQG
jgi:phosphate transport system substrate-binding protein